MKGKPWTTSEWDAMRRKLEKLSVDELRALTTRVGIRFTGGNAAVEDSRTMTAKEQFLNVLDEANPAQLKREYNQIVEERPEKSKT